MNRISICLSLLVACGATMAAVLPDKGVVERRQASMKEMAASVKTIAGMFGGKVAYDVQAFKQAAGKVPLYTSALAAEFPNETLGQPSAAKLEIGQSREEFNALADHIASLASALSRQADGAPADGIPKAMRMGPGMAMGGGSLLGKRSGAAEHADPSALAAEHLVHLILQDCTSCHAKFREKAP
ncbi:cytochrome c [Mesorhizobium sp. INR15]|nr:cytochrome c [Mesorhizobium sp. INR15]